jgi:hypothetical protein
MVFSALRYFLCLNIILPIGAKGLRCHTVYAAHSLAPALSVLDNVQHSTNKFAALNKFPPTLPIIWAQVAEKHFLRNSGGCPFKKKFFLIQRLNTNALATTKLTQLSTRLTFRRTRPLS